MLALFGFLCYAGWVFAVTINGKQRLIGYKWALFFAIISPLIGTIFTMYSPKLIEGGDNDNHLRTKLDLIFAVLFFLLAAVFLGLSIQMETDDQESPDIQHRLFLWSIVISLVGAGLYKLRLWNPHYKKNIVS
jgi:FtsH-binding integral membrane protein